jgi:hypothetical protein
VVSRREINLLIVLATRGETDIFMIVYSNAILNDAQVAAGPA